MKKGIPCYEDVHYHSGNVCHSGENRNLNIFLRHIPILLLLIIGLIGCSGEKIIKREATVGVVPVVMEIVRGDVSVKECDQMIDDALQLMRERFESSDDSSHAESVQLNTSVLRWRHYLVTAGYVDEQQVDSVEFVLPYRMRVGWAVDGAAELLIGKGVESAMISADGVYRLWGEMPESKWGLDVPVPDNDTTYFRIEPISGGLCFVDDLSEQSLFPLDSTEVDEEDIVIIWTPKAVDAAILAEAAFVIDRRSAFDMVAQRDSTGLFYMYPDDIGYLVESDREMASWIKFIYQ